LRQIHTIYRTFSVHLEGNRNALSDIDRTFSYGDWTVRMYATASNIDAERSYERMNIALTEAQKTNLQALGAIEEDEGEEK
jgi:hypothetical protein